MINFLGEPYTMIGMAVLAAGFILAGILTWWSRSEKEYDEEFKNYGD